MRAGTLGRKMAARQQPCAPPPPAARRVRQVRTALRVVVGHVQGSVTPAGDQTWCNPTAAARTFFAGRGGRQRRPQAQPNGLRQVQVGLGLATRVPTTPAKAPNL